MTLISLLINAVFKAPALDADTRFLSQSADMSDLERRMRQLDARQPFGPFGQNA